jgi:two-component system response regulator HydG
MTNKHNLLIVDDDPLNTDTLVEIFTSNGYEADAAYSGAEALRMAQEKRYSCLLSDIRMPKMNGVELLRAVKAIQPAIPIILMTAYSDIDLTIAGVKEGALVILIKPLDIERLLGHMSVMLKTLPPA